MNNAIKNKPLSALGIETDKSVSIGSNQLIDEDINIIFKMIGPEVSLTKFVDRFSHHKNGTYWDFLQGISQEQEYEDLWGVLEKINTGYGGQGPMTDWDKLQEDKSKLTDKYFGFKELKAAFRDSNAVTSPSCGYLQVQLTSDSLAIPLFRKIATIYDESIFVIQYLGKTFSGFYVINVSAGLERLSGNTEVAIENNRSAIHQVYKGDDFYLSAQAEQDNWLNDFPF